MVSRMRRPAAPPAWWGSRLRQPGPGRTTGPAGLTDVQAGEGAADDHALDLGGAFEDREDLGLRGSFRRSPACTTRSISTDSARVIRRRLPFADAAGVVSDGASAAPGGRHEAPICLMGDRCSGGIASSITRRGGNSNSHRKTGHTDITEDALGWSPPLKS
jgi:hypothetical protein